MTTRFTREDKRRRTILIPVLSPEFSEVMKVAIAMEGYKVEVARTADARAVALGKRHVHNDICFPAQLNVGELLVALESGRYRREEVAVGLSKNCNACRALQYSALARKALDDRGYPDIPIITSGADPYGIHPGFKLSFRFKLRSVQGMAFIDALNDLRQRTLPYELEPGASERAHAEFLARGMEALARGFRPVLALLDEAIDAFNAVAADRARPKPVVGIVGEILVNYHPAGNMDIGAYLLRHGMEPRFPPILEFFRQDVVNLAHAAEQGSSRFPVLDRVAARATRWVFDRYLLRVQERMRRFRFHGERPDIAGIAARAEGIMHRSFNSGEGWLMPGEIVSMIAEGVSSFVIVQPFGCLPNHISGRGTIKAIKERFPRVQILALDYDPDVSVANIENRLQMLVMGARELAAVRKVGTWKVGT